MASGGAGAGTPGNGGAPADAGSGGDDAGASGTGEAGTGPVGQMCTDSATDCSGTAPICDATDHSCRRCTGDPECSVIPDTPFCATAGRCVACKKDVDCRGATPVCGPAGECRACTTNSDCASSICDSGTGACGATSTAVYVLAKTGSSQATCGSFEEPCRDPALAAPKLTAARPNLVFLATQQAFDTGGATIPALPSVRVIGNDVMIQAYDGSTAFTVTSGNVTFEHIDVRGAKSAMAPGLNCSGGSVTIKNSHFQGNDLAVNATNCNLTISDSVLETNATPLANGFVAINATCSSPNCTQALTVERSRIQGNGKGLYTTVNATTLRNNLWINNGDPGNSGSYNRVFEFRGKTATVEFNTFVGNFNSCSYVGLLACDDGVCSATGNITWNNFPGKNCNDQVFYGFGNLLTYNLTEALQPGAGNKSADPKFVDAAMGDYTPGPGSPALDSANPVGAPTVDFNGKPRPKGDGPDIGAIERQ